MEASAKATGEAGIGCLRWAPGPWNTHSNVSMTSHARYDLLPGRGCVLGRTICHAGEGQCSSAHLVPVTTSDTTGSLERGERVCVRVRVPKARCGRGREQDRMKISAYRRFCCRRSLPNKSGVPSVFGEVRMRAVCCPTVEPPKVWCGGVGWVLRWSFRSRRSSLIVDVSQSRAGQ